MSTLPALKVLRLMALASLLFFARALAQFEVAPDHFDSAARQNTGKKKAKTERTATAHLVTDGSALAAATPRDRPSGRQSASRAARRLRSGKNLQPHLSRDHVLAAQRKPRDKEESAAASQ